MPLLGMAWHGMEIRLYDWEVRKTKILEGGHGNPLVLLPPSLPGWGHRRQELNLP